MSRKRDTNWTRDEISVLLDSIMEITRTRADDGKRTNSREIFEHAAKRMAERGHLSRAEREKCRTKWKKMKEEFAHAKRAREGDSRYKEAPGIIPFYDRMEEFINGNFDNISPHSTIVRRSSSMSSNGTTTNTTRSSPASRASARLAANSNGASVTNSSNNTDNNDTNSTIVSKFNARSDYSGQTPSNSSTSSRQNTRLSAVNSITHNNNNDTNTFPSTTVTTAVATTTDQIRHNHNLHANNQQPLLQTIPNGEGICTIYTSYNSSSSNDMPNQSCKNDTINNNGINCSSSRNSLNSSNDSVLQAQPAEQADIKYRKSPGYRQITIFGDHDVEFDIKFRSDRVIINKIIADCNTATTSSTPTET